MTFTLPAYIDSQLNRDMCAWLADNMAGDWYWAEHNLAGHPVDIVFDDKELALVFKLKFML